MFLFQIDNFYYIVLSVCLVMEQVMEITGENMLPWDMYKPYFFLEASNMTTTSFKVYCLLCLPYKIKLLSTSRCSASNLLRHLRVS